MYNIEGQAWVSNAEQHHLAI